MLIDRSAMFTQKLVENQSLLPYKDMLAASKGYSPEVQAAILKGWSGSKNKRAKK